MAKYGYEPRSTLGQNSDYAFITSQALLRQLKLYLCHSFFFGSISSAISTQAQILIRLWLCADYYVILGENMASNQVSISSCMKF